jgi:anti-sigma factor RsiW
MATAENVCKTIEMNLDAYHDHELEGEEKTAVEQHLGQCQDCTSKLADISRVVATIKAAPRLELSADFDAKLDQALQKQSKVVYLQPRVWAPVSIAAAVVIIALGLKLGESGNTVIAQNPMDAPPAIIKTEQSVKTTKPPVAKQTPNKTPANEEQTTDSQLIKEYLRRPKIATDKTAPGLKANEQPAVAKKNTPVYQQDNFEQYYTSDSDELADITGTTDALTEAVGIATDEDGLYDLKM